MTFDTQISHQQVMESMPFGVIQVDTSGKVVYANASAYDLTASKKGSLLGLHYEDFRWDQHAQNGKAQEPKDYALYKALYEERVVASDIQGTYINGRKRWFSVNAAPIYDNEGILVGAVANFSDVTDKIETEILSKDESARYRILIENINGVVWERSPVANTYTYISPRAKELLGFPLKEWQKKGFRESRIYKEDLNRVLEFEAVQMKKADHYELEYRLVHKEGKPIWVRDMVEVMCDEEGNPCLLRGITMNITETKMSQQRILENEKRYQKMISEAPYAVTIYNKEGILVAANEKSAEIWNVDINDNVGKFNIFKNNLFIKESQKEVITKAFRGERGELIAEVPLVHAGETRRTYHIKYYPLFDQAGELENVIYFTEDITSLVEAEKKAKREESLKQGILDALNQGILVVDEQGTIININRSLSTYAKDHSLSGLRSGKSVFEFITHLDNRHFLENTLRSVLERKVKVFDHEMVLPDGKWYNVRVTPLNEPFGAVVSWQNINTRKEMELALERSLKKYRNIYNKAPVMMHSINSRLEIISVSDFWLEKMGYERNEVIGKSPTHFMTHESKLKFDLKQKELFQKGEVRNVTYQYIKKPGEIMDVMLSAVSEYDENGNFERSITGMLDVTELRKTERMLQESQRKLLEAQRISKIANYEMDVQSGVFNPSTEMMAMMGFSNEDRHVSVIEKLIHPDDLPGFAEKLQICIREVKDFFHIYRIIHLKTKKIKWISGRGRMVTNEKGSVTHMIGTVQDITEQKQAEEKIRKLSDRILLAAEIANLGVWEYDKETNETIWEDQMYTIFSGVAEPLNIEQLRQYIVDYNGLIEEGLELIKNGVNFIESDFKVNIDGEEKYLRAFTRILRDETKKVKGMIGVVYDITADKRLQMLLETSLEEKNILIREVHHRVKNNIQLISSILALKSYELNDAHSRSIFEEVNQRIKAMAVIHDKLYTFHNVSEIEIGEYLRQIATELQILQQSSKISINISVPRTVLDVDKALLIGLMVSEMVSNAIKHGYGKDEKGRIEIQLKRKSDKMILWVVNDGKKMNKEILNSKSGLGMSLIKTFVKQLAGHLDIDEARNGFKVVF